MHNYCSRQNVKGKRKTGFKKKYLSSFRRLHIVSEEKYEALYSNIFFA